MKMQLSNKIGRSFNKTQLKKKKYRARKIP